MNILVPAHRIKLSDVDKFNSNWFSSCLTGALMFCVYLNRETRIGLKLKPSLYIEIHLFFLFLLSWYLP